MSAKAGSAVAEATGREIVATRVLDAPRPLVFRAWIDRENIGKWWGPQGFRTTRHEMDVRPGGAWRFTMHGPDGVDNANKIVYVEIAEPDRLVYDHVSGPRFHTTVTFEEEPGGRTRITVRMLFPSAEERDRVAEKFGAVEGLRQTLERLGEYVGRVGDGGRRRRS